jgi:hypothetical protein
MYLLCDELSIPRAIYDVLDFFIYKNFPVESLETVTVMTGKTESYHRTKQPGNQTTVHSSLSFAQASLENTTAVSVPNTQGNES